MAQKAADVAATSGAGKANPHAVVVVYPQQGHVIPVTLLSLRLAARAFAVTVVNTEAVHDQTARALGVDPAGYDFFAGARASGMDVRYELISDGLPVGFDWSLNHDEFMGSLLHAHSGHVEEVLGRVVVDPAATCLVADTFFVWPVTLASKFGIAYVSFWTEPALIFNLYYHVHLLTNNGHFDCNEPRKDTITYILGVPAIELHELILHSLMSYLQETDTTSVVHYIIFKAFEEAAAPTTFSATPWRSWSHPPSPPSAPRNPSTPSAPSSLPASPAVPSPPPCGPSPTAPTGWTNSRRGPCSTSPHPLPPPLYISFGSYAHVTKQELHEIAGGSWPAVRGFCG
ncbi:hypothetical protein VPH35_000825 [Triticum aestivum]